MLAPRIARQPRESTQALENKMCSVLRAQLSSRMGADNRPRISIWTNLLVLVEANVSLCFVRCCTFPRFSITVVFSTRSSRSILAGVRSKLVPRCKCGEGTPPLLPPQFPQQHNGSLVSTGKGTGAPDISYDNRSPSYESYEGALSLWKSFEGVPLPFCVFFFSFP
jgi:hypothetical protein